MEGAGKATMSISCFEQRVFFEKVTEVKLFATKAPRGTIFFVRGEQKYYRLGGKHTETLPKLFVFFLMCLCVFFSKRGFCDAFFQQKRVPVAQVSDASELATQFWSLESDDVTAPSKAEQSKA